MSLLIQGMTKPKHWRDCPFSNGAAQCTLKEYGLCGQNMECQLVEVPPHGRLIDADELMKSLRITDMDCEKCEWSNHTSCCTRGTDFTDACCAIEDAPTIIPADKEG